MPTDVKEIRNDTKKTIDTAYRELLDIVKGDFSPGYYNRKEVIDAETKGLSICDAILGHVINAPKDQKQEEASLELLTRIQRKIIDEEIVNQCHNLHGAVALMLDRIGCPAIMIWGSLNAISPRSSGFRLIAEAEPEFSGHRPGHCWLLTPYWSVTDLALAHQSGVGDDYEILKAHIPSLILERSQNQSEPERSWLRPSGQPSANVPDSIFCNATKYHDVIGWTEVKLASLTISYIPGAVTIPSEHELNEINILIGGKRPGDFFSQSCADLVSDSC